MRSTGMDIGHEEWKRKVRSFLAITRDMPPRERNEKLTALYRVLEDRGNSHFAEKHCGLSLSTLLQQVWEKERNDSAGFRPNAEHAASAFSSDRDMVECLLETLRARLDDIYNKLDQMQDGKTFGIDYAFDDGVYRNAGYQTRQTGLNLTDGSKLREMKSNVTRLILRRDAHAPLGFTLVSAFPLVERKEIRCLQDAMDRNGERGVITLRETGRDLRPLVQAEETYRAATPMRQVFLDHMADPDARLSARLDKDRGTGQESLVLFLRTDDPDRQFRAFLSDRGEVTLKAYRRGADYRWKADRVTVPGTEVRNAGKVYVGPGEKAHSWFEARFPQASREIEEVRQNMRSHGLNVRDGTEPAEKKHRIVTVTHQERMARTGSDGRNRYAGTPRHHSGPDRAAKPAYRASEKSSRAPEQGRCKPTPEEMNRQIEYLKRDLNPTVEALIDQSALFDHTPGSWKGREDFYIGIVQKSRTLLYAFQVIREAGCLKDPDLALTASGHISTLQLALAGLAAHKAELELYLTSQLQAYEARTDNGRIQGASASDLARDLAGGRHLAQEIRTVYEVTEGHDHTPDILTIRDAKLQDLSRAERKLAAAFVKTAMRELEKDECVPGVCGIQFEQKRGNGFLQITVPEADGGTTDVRMQVRLMEPFGVTEEEVQRLAEADARSRASVRSSDDYDFH